MDLRDREELLAIFCELSENPSEYSSRGALNSHGRSLALRFGAIAHRMGILTSPRLILGDGDYEKCIKRMQDLINSFSKNPNQG